MADERNLVDEEDAVKENSTKNRREKKKREKKEKKERRPDIVPGLLEILVGPPGFEPRTQGL